LTVIVDGTNGVSTTNLILNGTGQIAVAGSNYGTSGQVLTSSGSSSASTWASASGLGVGQTWTNVTGSRALGTTYTNSTSNPIFASVYVTGQTTVGVTITVSGNVVATFQWAGTNNNTSTTIIPAGATYSFSTGSGSLGSWWELR
jgi:hypothetical protein